MGFKSFLTTAGLALRAFSQWWVEHCINEEERLTERVTSLSVGARESELFEIEKLKRKRRRYREYLSTLRPDISYDDQG